MQTCSTNSPVVRQNMSLSQSRPFMHHHNHHHANNQQLCVAMNSSQKNKVLYSALNQEQRLKLFQNCTEMCRSRHSQAQILRTEGLMESMKIKQQLKSLVMLKKVNKYQHKNLFINKPNWDRTISRHIGKQSSQKSTPTNNTEAWNRRQDNTNEGIGQDQFSFRPVSSDLLVENPSNNQCVDQQKELGYGFKSRQLGNWRLYGDCRQSRRQAVNWRAFPLQSHNQNLAKLHELQNQRFLQQKQNKIQTQLLQSKIKALLENDPLNPKPKYNNHTTNNSIINKHNATQSYKNYNNSKTNTNNYICYSQSEKQLSNSSNDINYSIQPYTNQQSILFKKPSISKNLFDSIPQLKISHYSKISNQNHKSKQKTSKNSSQNKQKARKNSLQSKNHLSRTNFNNKKKFQNKDHQRLKKPQEMQLSYCSKRVKQHVLHRTKSAPFIIPQINYSRSQSNQNQLVQRKKVQQNRQKQVKQKIITKSKLNKLAQQQIQLQNTHS